MQILRNPISALNVSKSQKFSRSVRNRGRGTSMVILDWKCIYGCCAHAQWKICNV